MGQEVAVPLLFRVVAAGNDMHSKATATEMIERSELARGQSWSDEAWPMRQHQSDALGSPCRVRRDDKPVGAVAEIADQDSVEAGTLMRLRKTPDVIDIDRRTLGRMNFGIFARRYHADEFDIHCVFS